MNRPSPIQPVRRSDASDRLRTFGTPTILGLALFICGQGANAATYLVGGGGPSNGCTHKTLEAAVAEAASTPESDIIVLARDTTYSNVSVSLSGFSGAGVSGSLELLGGFDSCDDPSADFNDRTVIRGAAIGPIFHLDGGSQVNMGGLLLTGATSGYALNLEGSSYANVTKSSILDNAAGVRVREDSTLDVISSEIGRHDGDLVADGGGIGCENGLVRMANADIFENQAIDGGGLSIKQCRMQVLGPVLIRNNTATGFGGGVDLAGLSSSIDSPDPSASRLTILGNSAQRGGGIHASANSFFSVYNTVVAGNRAVEGAGVYVGFNSTVVLLRDFEACPGSEVCVGVNHNVLEASGSLGSAVFAAAGGEFYLYHGSMAFNRGTESVLLTVYVRDSSHASFVRTAIHNNEAVTLLAVTGSADSLVADSSIAANQASDAPGRPYFAEINAQADLVITNSIVVDTLGSIVLDDGSVSQARCLITDGDSAAGLPATASAVADPLFLGAPSGDLRISSMSPAVDLCDGSSTMRDLFGNVSPYDLASNPNGAPGVAGGTADAGVHEVEAPVVLFGDGFETGDTTGWG